MGGQATSRKTEGGDRTYHSQRCLWLMASELCLLSQFFALVPVGPRWVLVLGPFHLPLIWTSLSEFLLLATQRHLTGTWVHFSTFLLQIKHTPIPSSKLITPTRDPQRCYRNAKFWVSCRKLPNTKREAWGSAKKPFGLRRTCVLIWTASFTCCVTLGKQFKLPETILFHLDMGETPHAVLLRGLEIIPVLCWAVYLVPEAQ